MSEITLLDGNNADGNTPKPVENTDMGQLAQQASEAKKAFLDTLKPSPATAAKPETVQPSTTPQETPKEGEAKPAEAGNKDDVPKQFQAKDGSLDEDKILKSTQNQEQLNAKKREMLERYKTLQREGSQIDKSIKEVKPKEGQEEVSPPKAEPSFNDFLSGELTKEELAALDAEKDNPFVRALLKSQAALARATTDDIRRDVEQSKAQKWEVSQLQRLDELSNSHSWLYTDEGQKRLAEVFKEDPGLWKTQDPYGYAVGRLAHSMTPAQQTGAARPVGTPMLGAGHALPPSQAEPVTPSQELDKISQNVLYNIDNRPELRKAENDLRNKFRDLISKR